MRVRVSRRSEALQDRPCALAAPPGTTADMAPSPAPHASGSSSPRA